MYELFDTRKTSINNGINDSRSFGHRDEILDTCMCARKYNT